MEKRELEILGKEIQELENRKDEINNLFNDKNLPFDDIKTLSNEVGEIIKTMEKKEYRRFELMEKE